MGLRGGGRPNPVFLPDWVYLGGEVIAGDGGSQAATLPAGTTIFEIDAEAGNIQYALNLGFAPAAASGFCPMNGARIQGPLVNLTRLAVNMAVGVTAHILYYRENTNRK